MAFRRRHLDCPQRRAFGSDLTDPQLIIASEPANSAKGDSGPDQWKPSSHAIWCAYSEDYTHIKSRFHLTTSTTEKASLTQMLTTCR